MITKILSNGGMVLRLSYSDDCLPLAQRLTGFLMPYFSSSDSSEQVDLAISLHAPEHFSANERARCTEPFHLRKSSAAMFNLNVQLGLNADGDRLAWDDEREVGYCINVPAATVRFYGGAPAFIHLIELIRYYGLLVEQAKGSIVLHSAAVISIETNKVSAIVGPKGAGKTTTMLALIASGKYRYFSGDKVLLDMHDGYLRARGWPDFPHIGMGTLRQHVQLSNRLGIAFEAEDGTVLSDKHKVLIDPALLMANLDASEIGHGHLGELILPSVEAVGNNEFIALNDTQKKTVNASDLFEWPHEFVTACWHGLQPKGLDTSKTIPEAVSSALLNTPWYYLLGKPRQRVSAQSADQQ